MEQASQEGATVQFVIDMEVTNRCNAKCHFCPRDRTPHQGLMPAEVFETGLQRAVEFRSAIADPAGDTVRVSLCGLGEPLLNRRVVDYCRQARAEGFSVVMSSNGSLLDERRSAALLEAGLQQILINVGEEGDDYEEVYQLPFERTLENVVRFNEMSSGACEVIVVLVDHRGDPEHLERMRRYWSKHGIQQAVTYEIMNRGGSLFIDHMQYEHYPELAEARARLASAAGVPLCGAPFGYLFVGYDGQYYLCCSDWEKQAPLGSVFDKSFVDVAKAKLDLVVSRDPVCRTCNLDPINRLTEELRAEGRGDLPPGSADTVQTKIVADNEVVEGCLHQLGLEVPDAPPGRRLIPVRAV
jgi:MoaA/NifB/PqqE/SkfB family radical SAM enzyme